MADDNVPSLIFCRGSDQEEDQQKKKTLSGHKTRYPARPSVTPEPHTHFRSTHDCRRGTLLLFADGFAKRWVAIKLTGLTLSQTGVYISNTSQQSNWSAPNAEHGPELGHKVFRLAVKPFSNQV